MRRHDILSKEAQIKQWISEHRSKAFICSQLNCRPMTLEAYLAKMNIVYKGNQGGRGYKTGQRKPASDYLYKGSIINPHHLKLKLIRDGIKIAECESCHTTTWLNGDVPLELHHINGDRYDNRLKNLQLLCPNCHALTDNHAGKAHKALKKRLSSKKVSVSVSDNPNNNRFVSTLVFDSAESRNSWHKIPLERRSLINNGDGSYGCKLEYTICSYCGKSLASPDCNTYCSRKCYRLASRKVIRPSKEELEKLVWSKPTRQIAQELGISDKAIEKWCKAYGINKPSRGYWTKKEHGKI